MSGFVNRRVTRLRSTDKNLVQKVLDELLLQRPRGEQAVQIGAEQFGDKIAVSTGFSMGRDCVYSPTYMSSSGEMKMSLRLMTWTAVSSGAHVCLNWWKG